MSKIYTWAELHECESFKGLTLTERQRGLIGIANVIGMPHMAIAVLSDLSFDEAATKEVLEDLDSPSRVAEYLDSRIATNADLKQIMLFLLAIRASEGESIEDIMNS